jgi:monoterpene epsilon-lactone hydrolase
MVSTEHQELVARIEREGLRTPETLPNAIDFDVIRAVESTAPLPPTGAASVSSVEADGVPCLWVDNAGQSSTRVVIYLHGGGYIWMSASTHQAVMAQISAASDARCLGVDYRRAPEHPFPAAVDDALTAYTWLLGQGTSPQQIAIAGDSAGGGLVLALLLALRDRGIALPAAGICVSPWTDLLVTGSTADTAPDPVVSGPALRAMAAAYLAGAGATQPTASPLYGDLTGLPPLLIQVGTRESLLDDARRFAAKARAAGVDVSYIEHPDVIHMWLVFAPDIPESEKAFRLIGEFVQKHLSAKSASSSIGTEEEA